ncbi:MAG: hypothetical protein RIT04_442 [Candidatus Parcubacteria bacterium]|jgi:hypothetical protein
MQKLTVFETTIIGFFVGVVISIYSLFMLSDNGFVGMIIQYLSLHPLFERIQVPANYTLIASFLFGVAVYTLYGTIIGFIMKGVSKMKYIVLPLVLIAVAAGAEQFIGAKHHIATAPAPFTEDSSYQTALAIQALTAQKKQQQYFGTEAIGDLNNDGKDDIAFIIQRNDDERGTLYYVTTALASTTGKAGTNLLFLGDKVQPQNIAIENALVLINYTEGRATSTKTFYARVNNTKLEKTTAPISATSTATTTATTTISSQNATTTTATSSATSSAI